MSKHHPAPDRSELPPLGPDDAPYDLDSRRAIRGRNVPWLRAVQDRGQPKQDVGVVAVHLESGETAYEAYHHERSLGRFASVQEAWKAAQRALGVAASGPPVSR